MKFKLLIITLFLCSTYCIYGENKINSSDSIPTKQEISDPDSVLENFQEIKTSKPSISVSHKSNLQQKSDTVKKPIEPEQKYYKIPSTIETVHVDSLILQGNPFFIELVFMGYSTDFKFEQNPDFQSLLYGYKPSKIDSVYIIPPKTQTVDKIITDLRRDARDEITRKKLDVYIMSFDELPDPDGTKSHIIKGKSMNEIRFVDTNLNTRYKKLVVKKVQLGPWQAKASGMAQFSQNFVSSNWYQGGNSNIAVLGILSGQLIYDNKKNIQWENTGEWRMGFNSVEGDTIHLLNTNDDVFRINSKLGIKAGGNWFYSGSADFSTQFFNTYKGLNSTAMKTTFLTPIRVNIGMGLDYKFEKLFSIMISPIAYKYIYINQTDAAKINPNLFGIKAGDNHLSEVGSSFRAQCAFSPFPELQVFSRLSFYTNYEKVEIDWEIVGNFTINRYLSTRISLNPRYDNTVILAAGEKAKLQFKELLSFGISYKLLN